MKIYSAEQMRKTDSEAINEYGIDGIVLMENAATAVKNEILRANIGRKCVLVLCGRGNNGGDGFAVARRLLGCFDSVKVAFFEDEGKLGGDCKKNYEIVKKLGIKFITDVDEMEKYARTCDVIVDALYGFGFHGSLSPSYRHIAEIINASSAYVVSVDVPSGVCADLGECEFAIRADKTVTFTGYKPAQLTFPAAEFCGDVCVADIGIPKAILEKDYIGESIQPELVAAMPPKRERNAHKGTCGKVFVVGGSLGMSGAVCMSAMSAMKSGAGLVTAGVPQCINTVFEQKVTEAMSLALSDDENGMLSEEAAITISDFATKCDTLIIGPGMGRSDSITYILRDCLKTFNKNIVIDADALFALASDVSILDGVNANIIITPHYAEMGRLIGESAEYVGSHSIECARSFSQSHNVTVVLKGAYTVIAGNDCVYVNNCVGNAGMATGGSGDVLSGIIGALVCRIDNPTVAAACGVYLHALAGDIAAERFGMESMLAGDIANSLADAFKKIR